MKSVRVSGEKRFVVSRLKHAAWGLVLIGTLVTLVSGCGNLRTGEAEIYGIVKFKMPAFPETGSNKIQIFTEMHYQPSYRSQEGPRLLPPQNSVPRTGKELVYTPKEYMGLQLPDQMRASYNPIQAAELFAINCAVCHGDTMEGDGIMKKKMEEQGSGPLPADLTANMTQDSKTGELFGFISNGGRQGQAQRNIYEKSARGSCDEFRGFLRPDCLTLKHTSTKPISSPMPEFAKLLTPEERWWLTIYIQSQ